VRWGRYRSCVLSCSTSGTITRFVVHTKDQHRIDIGSVVSSLNLFAWAASLDAKQQRTVKAVGLSLYRILGQDILCPSDHSGFYGLEAEARSGPSGIKQCERPVGGVGVNKAHIGFMHG
jgi:hypothetical protein